MINKKYLKLCIMFVLLLLCGCTPQSVGPIKIAGYGNTIEETIESYETEKNLRFYEYYCPYEPKEFRGKFFLPDFNNLTYLSCRNYIFNLATSMRDEYSYTDRITKNKVSEHYLLGYWLVRFKLDTSDISGPGNFVDIYVQSLYNNAYSEYDVNPSDLQLKRNVKLQNKDFTDIHTLDYGYLQLNENSEDEFDYLYIEEDYYIVNERNENVVINRIYIEINYTKGFKYRDFLYLYSDDYNVNPDLIGLKGKLDNLYIEGFNEFSEKEIYFSKD